jgi:hypothetical protein
VKIGKQGRRCKQLLGETGKRELTGNRKRRQQTALSREVEVEKSTAVS